MALPAVVAAYRLVGAQEATALAAALGTSAAPAQFHAAKHLRSPYAATAAPTSLDADWRFWGRGTLGSDSEGMSGAPLLPAVEAAATMMAAPPVTVAVTATGEPRGAAEGKALTLEALQKEPFPDGVDCTRREMYLSDAEFESLLGVNKEEWEKVPKWKKDREKKKHGLF